ncbi:hypothetical protein N656DRAFT_801904 [Canariomyces notabilis]|uniref:Uncharacterized protein n=1 Tax=Canariomyces notabilis TaxID=2074819 RepID=A0AAN6QDN3_9PEZI|nr:hypothetical protein N656DRAFT_801904 [Canariomyces arenarius]
MQLKFVLLGLATAAMALPSARLHTRQENAVPDASIGTAADTTDNRDMRRDNHATSSPVDITDNRDMRRDNHATSSPVDTSDNRDWRRDNHAPVDDNGIGTSDRDA